MSSAADLHAAAHVLDGHADTPQRFLDEGWEFASDVAPGHMSQETARAGNLAGELFAIWVEPAQWRGRFAYRTLTLIDAVREQVRRHAGTMRLCLSARDVVEARREGRFAAMMSLEGGHAIEDSLGLLRLYFELGVRAMTLTWANSNGWAESSGEAREPGGLTEFGRAVIGEMNRLGMMVDVSHASDRTFWDVLGVCRAPVIASHSSARALAPSPRNLTDEMLRAVAGTGGVAMVNFYPGFLREDWRQGWLAMRPEREAAYATLGKEHGGRPVPFHVANRVDREFARRLARPSLGVLIDHIDHMVEVAGGDHVGLGSDFDGIPALPEGIESAADLPKVTAALLERGHAPETVRKILGENFLRVFGAVEAAATSTPESRPG